MGLFDNWSWSDTWSALGTVGNLAATGYDIYSGIKAANQASKYADLAFGSIEKQDEYASEAWQRQKEKYWPLEDLNIQYSMEDLQTLRPLGQAQAQYAVDRGLADIQQQRELDPLYRDTEKSVIRKLTEGEDVIRDRLMNQATADVAAGYAQQREQDTRAMGMAGINANSGAYANYMNRMGSQQALSEAMARTQASRQAEDLALSRQSQALNYRKGASLQTYQATPSVNSSSILSGLGSAGGNSANLAGMFNQQAQNSWAGAARGLQYLTGGNV